MSNVVPRGRIATLPRRHVEGHIQWGGAQHRHPQRTLHRWKRDFLAACARSGTAIFCRTEAFARTEKRQGSHAISLFTVGMPLPRVQDGWNGGGIDASWQTRRLVATWVRRNHSSLSRCRSASLGQFWPHTWHRPGPSCILQAVAGRRRWQVPSRAVKSAPWNSTATFRQRHLLRKTQDHIRRPGGFCCRIRFKH